MTGRRETWRPSRLRETICGSVVALAATIGFLGACGQEPRMPARACMATSDPVPSRVPRAQSRSCPLWLTCVREPNPWVDLPCDAPVDDAERWAAERWKFAAKPERSLAQLLEIQDLEADSQARQVLLGLGPAALQQINDSQHPRSFQAAVAFAMYSPHVLEALPVMRRHQRDPIARAWMLRQLRWWPGLYSPGMKALMALGPDAGGFAADIERLLGWLDDRTWPVAGPACKPWFDMFLGANAVQALGMIGLPSSVPILVRATSVNNWRMQVEAIRALARMGGAAQDAIAPLAAVADHHWSAVVRNEAVKALFQIRQLPAWNPRDELLAELGRGGFSAAESRLDLGALPADAVFRKPGHHTKGGCALSSEAGGWRGVERSKHCASDVGIPAEHLDDAVADGGDDRPDRVCVRSASDCVEVPGGWLLAFDPESEFSSGSLVFLERQTFKQTTAALGPFRRFIRSGTSVAVLAGGTMSAVVFGIDTGDGPGLSLRYLAELPAWPAMLRARADGSVDFRTPLGDVTVKPDGSLAALCQDDTGW